MSREEFLAATRRADAAFNEVRRLDALRYFPGASDAWRRAYGKWQEAEREVERLYDEIPDDDPPTPDPLDDDDLEAALELNRELRAERGEWDAEERHGGTRPNL